MNDGKKNTRLWEIRERIRDRIREKKKERKKERKKADSRNFIECKRVKYKKSNDNE